MHFCVHIERKLIFVINPEHTKVFAWLLMHVIILFISMLSDFVTSHKSAFYSKLYDIDLLKNFTHDRRYITLYVHEFLLSLHQHCFLDKKGLRTTLIIYYPRIQDLYDIDH